ncbi:hypothetical protein SKAU_G00083130 [Synaphobranchus kaupii]|uniref:Uncharacterized protein n=1 Tax=Synaphobranchus kaupii TaxID=118154 RepID=A0A9Q1FV71_SYNKA|nr:hypothetical protein SKAU_G00083130 [Synaphobranchus kaupii]
MQSFSFSEQEGENFNRTSSSTNVKHLAGYFSPARTWARVCAGRAKAERLGRESRGAGGFFGSGLDNSVPHQSPISSTATGTNRITSPYGWPNNPARRTGGPTARRSKKRRSSSSCFPRLWLAARSKPHFRNYECTR